jgi:hypothetical protein
MAVDYVHAKEMKAEQQITAAKMKFMWRRAGYTRLDYKSNLDIMKELNAQPVIKFI